MATAKLSYMLQDSSLMNPYVHETGIRAKSKSDFWSTPTSNAAQPASKTPSASSMWGPSLSVLSNNTASSTVPPHHGHNALAALAANSEPVSSNEPAPTPSAMTSPSFEQASLGTANSHLASRQNSHSDSPSPVLATPLLMGSANAMPSTPQTVSAKGASSASHTPSFNDEIINTAIVVKNIPFAIKKEQLIDFMTQLGLPLPYAFNYHFDNGVFRGLAFANFATAEETSAVIGSLNGRELGGRRLRVEYKKMLPYQERERIEREKRERRGQLEEQHQKPDPSQSPLVQPASHQHSHHSLSSALSSGSLASLAHVEPATTLASRTSSRGSSSGHFLSGLAPLAVDMNDPEVLDTYTSLVAFKKDSANRDLVIPAAQAVQWTPNQTHVLNSLCERLELTCGVNDEQDVYIAKRSKSDESDAHLSGLLRYAVPSLSGLRSKASPGIPLQAATVGHHAPAAMHHPSFPNVSSSLAHDNGLHRWNSVGNLSGAASAGSSYAK